MNNDKYGIVYMINNKINNKKYIGITTRQKGFDGRYSAKGIGIERVFNFMNTSSSYNMHLYNSINKYGFDNFEVFKEIDCAYSKQELLEKERYWIKYYKSNDYLYGYNNTNGGEGLDGGSQSIISRLKRRITKAERFNFILEYWYKERQKWDNQMYYIWDYQDGFNSKEKHLLYHKLNGGKTKFCKICGIEYYRSGKGDYCKQCGNDDLLELKKLKKILNKLDYKNENLRSLDNNGVCEYKQENLL